MAKKGRKAKREAARAERARQAETDAAAPTGAEPTAAATASDADADSTALPAPSSASVPASATAQATSHAAANAFIGLFLLFMLAMPLRYYLGGRGHDERFSWRMFSTIRLQKCDAKVTDVQKDGTERPVKLDRLVQVAWIGMLERNRPLVVQRVLERRCTQEGNAEVRYALSCRAPDGSKLPDVHKQLDCASGVLTERAGDPP